MQLPDPFECWQNRIEYELDSKLLAPDIVSTFKDRLDTATIFYSLRNLSAGHASSLNSYDATCTVQFTVTRAKEVKDMTFASRSKSKLFDEIVEQAALRLAGNKVLQFPHKISDSKATFEISVTRGVVLKPDGKTTILPKKAPNSLKGM
jgi:hypothetical protein